MEEGKTEEDEGVTIPGLEAIWEVALESTTQSELPGGVSVTVLNALARDCGSQGLQTGGCCIPRPAGGEQHVAEEVAPWQGDEAQP